MPFRNELFVALQKEVGVSLAVLEFILLNDFFEEHSLNFLIGRQGINERFSKLPLLLLKLLP